MSTHLDERHAQADAQPSPASDPVRLIIAICAVLLVLLAVAALAVLVAGRGKPAGQTTTEFQDRFGRVCRQVTTAQTVALDCDFRPVESRVSGLLDGLTGDPSQ